LVKKRLDFSSRHTAKTEVNIMGKNMDTKKDAKKKPAKTMKEKRAEKKSKKETKGS